MKKKIIILSMIITLLTGSLLAGTLLTGCSKQETALLNPNEPVVITLWHAYNAYAKAVFDKQVQLFNETVGLEQGIVVDAYGYGTSEELDEALYNSANRMIGASPMPDLFTAYPDSAYRLDQITPLADLRAYFSEEELSAYRPEFLKEGIWGEDNAIKMIPIAKSTELLFVNGTDWDVFKEETNITDNHLSTWEGLAEAARTYYAWSGGKPLLGMNSYNDFAFLTAAQLGVDPYEMDQGNVSGFNYPEEAAKRIWDVYYVPHIMGWYKSQIFNQDGIKSGNLICYIGSSAGAGYFPKHVILNEQNEYEIECRVFPYPVFNGGQEYMTQRGANMGVSASDKVREYAAAEFLKWFTASQQNIEFTVSTGYIPVKEDALSSVSELLQHVKEGDNSEAVKKSASAALNAMKKGIFYSKKVFPGSYRCDELFKESLEKKVEIDLYELEARTAAGETREAVQEELVREDNFKEWYQSLLNEMAGSMNE
ncbi:extracellular solute-binding protein [Clostridium sp. MCC353]|uniref:extracellular solute-binding protein n=1 Tax=Clostridium sp. MCC353 TaxID=2592646 RepID=UPI001C0248BC|nr:extracellular solute-binding protein [Clostridium sp. MCC353]MBT9779459.1 extracellular solute-binding protein [Clostridium sp. MCC353]